MAIELALASPEFDIVGLTTVFGNCSVEQGTENALRIVDLAGRADIPVAEGAAKPWKGPFKGGVPFIHGEDGQGNTFSPPSTSKPIHLSAADSIIEQVSQFPGEITLTALGPLTNIADAAKKEPGIVDKVKEIVFMGGSAFGPGNATKSSEANILSDPEAADFVFSQHWPMTMLGLDVTEKTFFSKADAAELAQIDNKITRQVMSAHQFYMKFFYSRHNREGSFIHDPSVFAYLLQPELYKTASRSLRVKIGNGKARGKTLPSPEGDTMNSKWEGRKAVNICVEVDGEGVVRLLKRRLLGAKFPC